MDEPTIQLATRSQARASRQSGRSGRNLPAAIAVGVGLGVIVVATLLIRKESFLAFMSVCIGVAVWELAQALQHKAIVMPIVPVLVGAVAMTIAAFSAGGQALTVCFILTVVGIVVWRTSEGAEGALRDVSGGIFSAAYLPLLAGFIPLMLSRPDGQYRVLTFIVTTACSDTGGFFTGVLFGRHSMSPTVSPNKSWEGFAGSVLACVLGATICIPLLLGGPVWAGPLLGIAVAVTATIGDLSESLIKRDLGIKDMGSVLPGHGGVLDRIDSLVFTAPVAWLILHLVV
jgi:phosphatidate cytidylyltransferase